MTIHLVTFADESMIRSRYLCAASARDHGVDRVYECGPDEPSTERGYGFWRWKPRIIYSVMTDASAPIPDGDILIYSDAGVEFIGDVNNIIGRMDQDIFLFGNNWEHAHWCKRDLVEAVWPWHDERVWDRFGKQCQASVIFFRVSDFSREFVKEWLDWALFEGGRLIDDSPSRTPNHPEFREHRHDQAILTTLAYREGIKLHYWPATYSVGVYEKLPCYAGDDYPILFDHHRRRNHESGSGPEHTEQLMLGFANKYAKNYFTSQNGEEGILLEVCRRLGIDHGHAVEIGGNNGLYCSNTALLLKDHGWSGLFVETDYNLYLESKQNWKDNLQVRHQCCRVDGNNIHAFVDDSCDLLSLDTDGSDFHIFEGLRRKPKIVIIEIDSSYPPQVSAFNKDGAGTYRNTVELGISKGYFLLCHTGNLVFVADEYRNLFPEIVGNGLSNCEEYFNNAWLMAAVR